MRVPSNTARPLDAVCTHARAGPQLLAAARRVEGDSEWRFSIEASFMDVNNVQTRDLLQVGRRGTHS